MQMMKIKLLSLAIALTASSVALGANDIPEKQLLQYKYVIFIQYLSLDSKDVRKIYYIENKAEMQETVIWLNKYSPERDALHRHLRSILAHCAIIFTNKLPIRIDKFRQQGDSAFGIYMNFNIDGKIYFTEEQLTALYKIFEEKGTPLKFDDTPKASDK